MTVLKNKHYAVFGGFLQRLNKDFLPLYLPTGQLVF